MSRRRSQDLVLRKGLPELLGQILQKEQLPLVLHFLIIHNLVPKVRPGYMLWKRERLKFQKENIFLASLNVKIAREILNNCLHLLLLRVYLYMCVHACYICAHACRG